MSTRQPPCADQHRSAHRLVEHEDRVSVSAFVAVLALHVQEGVWFQGTFAHSLACPGAPAASRLAFSHSGHNRV